MNADRWIFLHPLSSKDRKAVTPPFPGTTKKRNMKIPMLLLEVDGKGVSMEISVFLFSSRTERNKEFFLLILLYSICMLIIPNRTKRTEKLPCSFLRQNRTKKGICYVHFTLQHVYLHYYRQDEKNIEISFSFLRQNRKEQGIFRVPLTSQHWNLSS